MSQFSPVPQTPPIMGNSVWTRFSQLPGGHRLFFTDRPKLVAIADRSAELPQDTNDGILWLDFEKDLKMAGSGCFIPALTPDSEPKTVFGSPPDLLVLAATFNWRIVHASIPYTVARVT